MIANISAPTILAVEEDEEEDIEGEEGLEGVEGEEGAEGALITLKVDGEDNRVICRAIQRHVVKDYPIHADFLRLSQNSRINLMIPVEFTNEEECPGLRQGGVLTVVRGEIEMKVLASEIPEDIKVDISGLEIGDTVKISDITLPAGAVPTISDRDFMIANISAPTILAIEEDEEEDIEGEEGLEGVEGEEGAEGAAEEGAEGATGETPKE